MANHQPKPEVIILFGTSGISNGAPSCCTTFKKVFRLDWSLRVAEGVVEMCGHRNQETGGPV